MAKLHVSVVTLPDQVLHQLDQGRGETLYAIFQNASLVQIASVYPELCNKLNKHPRGYEEVSPTTKCTVSSGQLLSTWHTVFTSQWFIPAGKQTVC